MPDFLQRFRLFLLSSSRPCRARTANTATRFLFVVLPFPRKSKKKKKSYQVFFSLHRPVGGAAGGRRAMAAARRAQWRAVLWHAAPWPIPRRRAPWAARGRRDRSSNFASFQKEERKKERDGRGAGRRRVEWNKDVNGAPSARVPKPCWHSAMENHTGCKERRKRERVTKKR